MLSRFFKKHFALPLPKALGHDSNALQMRDFDPFISPSEYCWEDWEKEVRVRFPVRWFFNKTLPKLFRPIRRIGYRMGRVWYWVQCHTLPSYKFHIVDIRETKSSRHSYRFGWIDSDGRMLLANFAILRDFVEKEKPSSLREYHTEEEIDAMGARSQQDAYDEVMALYRWWTLDRHTEEDRVDGLFDLSEKATTSQERHKLVQDWSQARDQMKNMEDEMLIRLIKVRGTMWT
jgi:hypothetical protein